MNLNIGQALGILALLSAIVGGARAWQQHLADDAFRDQRIHQLQILDTSEHPAYSKMLDWVGDK